MYLKAYEQELVETEMDLAKQVYQKHLPAMQEFVKQKALEMQTNAMVLQNLRAIVPPELRQQSSKVPGSPAPDVAMTQQEQEQVQALMPVVEAVMSASEQEHAVERPAAGSREQEGADKETPMAEEAEDPHTGTDADAEDDPEKIPGKTDDHKSKKPVKEVSVAVIKDKRKKACCC